ncbi:4Fe-4S ferredoxin iron-sulfur binding domain protein [Chloroherpeton thalassium ATCC 35110]|uniref:4Fe-4S ferredoxin iron-sulfur binding domain protein n=1 Tax=Chloroherpeton thalassium (strain ATCC 35110 / GB-78) TaxID=517418 RepID=B3QTV6_CHLT3|nr:4Fe-4S dicluster domain-containing protein [Chloroherpeton thalassium]ACF14304.1 4Fe-4S ferredoxin iron-sulfur binding domain protein [Chloroherpeton thalassium ATCC 35110]
MARYGMVMDMRACVGCQACMAACSMENQTPYWSEKFRTHVEDSAHGEYPNVRRELLPRLCMHCENTPCLSACPTGATYKTEDGIVRINYDRCIGCYACMIACPYDARYPYDGDDVEKAEALYGSDCSHTMPHVDKCSFCEHRVKSGLEPACAATCPTGARIFGDLDDPNSEVHKLSVSGIARPLRAELGTSPKVFYIPA